jgi:hypothetical protein
VATAFRFSSAHSRTVDTLLLRFMHGRQRCCLCCEISTRPNPAVRTTSCPPSAKNAKSGAPALYFVRAIQRQGHPSTTLIRGDVSKNLSLGHRPSSSILGTPCYTLCFKIDPS